MTIPAQTLAKQPLAATPEGQASPNPYRPQAPAGGTLFVGRQSTFSWFQEALTTNGPEQPLILTGPRRIGITSFLQQLAEQDEGRFLYLSLEGVTATPSDQFLWALTQRLGEPLKQVGRPVPFVTVRDFSQEPVAAFKTKVLQPLLQQADSDSLVLLVDDAGPLFGEPAAPTLRQLLYEITQGEENLRLVLACAGHQELDDFAPFPAPLMHTLGPLTAEAALELLRRPAPFRIPDEVAEYLLSYAGGKPALLQQLGHDLFERRQQQQLRQLAVADAVLITRRQRTAERRKLPVPAVLTPTSYRAPTRHSGGWLAFALLVLLLGLLAAGLLLAGWPPLPEDGRAVLAALGLSPPESAPAAATQPAPASPLAAGASLASATAQATAAGSAPLAAVPASGTFTATAPASATTAPSPIITAPAAAPAGTGGLRFRLNRPADEMAMQLIVSGTFTMGAVSDSWAAPHETPPREVTLSSYYIDVYEVSVAQYADFLNNLAGEEQAVCGGFDCVRHAGEVPLSHLLLETLPDGTQRYRAEAGFEQYPINNVSWFGAQAYCQAVEARLPTEAEWEYAAQGPDGRRFPWGNELPDGTRAVYGSPDGFAGLKAVDALPRGVSPFGLYAMAGSMWEWVADWYDAFAYVDGPPTNPTGPEEGTYRVLRGGAWPTHIGPDQLRVTHRYLLLPETMNPDVGFRCARNAGSALLPELEEPRTIRE